ncbi:MAG: hypothetical protein IKM66_10320 [Clostridia bacterium]|nr:hypothetical protein [Clostridia bacterium]
MKKCLLLILILFSLLFLASCKESEAESYVPHYGFTEMNEEASSFFVDTNISNADKNDAVSEMADYAFAEAEKYRTLIKEEYKRILDEYKKAGMNGYSYDDMCKELDEYFDYLKNEYEANIEFYACQAYALYGSGSAGASYNAHKQYECAKAFLDKAELLYNEVNTGK